MGFKQKKKVNQKMKIWLILAYLKCALIFAAFISRQNQELCPRISLKVDDSNMFLINGLQLKGKKLDNVVMDTGSSDLIISKDLYRGDASFEPKYVMRYGSTGNTFVSQEEAALKGEGWKLSKFTYFRSNSSSLDGFAGILGVGYIANEVAGADYDNLPAAMAKYKGFANVFSLDGRNKKPSLILGGVDSQLYEGTLVKTPIGLERNSTSVGKKPKGFLVTVNSISVDSNDGKKSISNQNLIYLLDTGSEGLVIPKPVYKNLLATMNDKKKTVNDTIFFEHNFLETVKLNFSITGYHVSIPLLELIDETIKQDLTNYSSLKIIPVDIGDQIYEGSFPSVLYKYTYVVFDIQNSSILMAPYKSYAPLSGTFCNRITGSSYSIPTESAPDSQNTYSALYDASKETDITKAKE